jgi:hypothetical protein
VSTELVVRGLAAGRVPLDSYVCEVGGTAWKPVGEVRDFTEAVAIAAALKVEERPSGRAVLPRFDANDDRTMVDVEPMVPSDAPRNTDRAPSRSSRVPPLARFDGGDDLRTVTDVSPPLSSDPSTEKDVARKASVRPPKRRLEIVEELTLTDSEPFFPPE